MKIFIFLLCLLSFSFSVNAQETRPPVVVELFSSQGCPACPPADRYMGQLAKAGHVIALSCHVDYFNVAFDSLGKSFCTKRQTVYRYQLKKKTMYTPQMVINGRRDAIGYKKKEIAQAIALGRKDSLAPITIVKRPAGVYNFSLPERSITGEVELILVPYDRLHEIERRGRKQVYHHVIHHIMPLGSWGGSAIDRAVYPPVSSRHAGFVILAQDKNNGRILAAGEFKF